MSNKLTFILLTAVFLTVFESATAQQTDTDPRVRVVTNLGNFTIRLDPNRAPMTVESFLGTVDSGYYEGTIFHRVIAGFVAQAGGFTPDVQPKETDTRVINESGNGLSNLRGTVGMARSNDPHSGSTQFYINLADNLDLNPRPTRWGYAVFGTIDEGMDVIDTIGHSSTSGGGPFDRNVPVTPIVIERIERLSE
jgi:cyclophilin family peptidyl-prolyl cis-trans isomerase